MKIAQKKRSLKTPTMPGLSGADRSAARMTPGSLVRTGPLADEGTAPWVIQPAGDGVDLATWAGTHRAQIDELFAEHRALLFRGFDIRTVEQFQVVAGATSEGEPLEYRDRSTPRHTVGEGVYVSTIYPPAESIRLHCEGTYWQAWALKIYFCCLQSSARGGATPIADVRRVYQRIDPEIRRRFEDLGVLYVRNYGDGFGLTWQDVFQTESRDEVETYGRQNAIDVEWKEGGRLRTRQRRPAVRRHPQTGELTWFNHGAFFHVSSLEPAVREALLAEFALEDLPYNTYYGDGSPIGDQELEAIRQAYEQEKIVYPWQDGDILLLDNMCFAHGREPYEGERKVVVAMMEPYAGEE